MNIGMIIILLFLAAMFILGIFIEAFGDQNELLAFLYSLGMVGCLFGALYFALT